MVIMTMALFIGFMYWISLMVFKKIKAQIEPKHSAKYIIYAEYKLTILEKVGTLLIAAILLFAVGYLFYLNFAIAGMFSLSSFYFLELRRKRRLKQRKAALISQFKQALYALSACLSAGRSLENSIQETVADLQMLYANPQTLIIVEFTNVIQKLRNGENIESALHQFSERAQVEDIYNFVDVLTVCKRSGGNIIEVIRRTAAMIGEKIEVQQDIALLIAQKKFESQILIIAPLAIIATLCFGSPDYMQPLYHGMTGRAIMTCAFLFLLLSYAMIQKIMKIQV